MEVSVGQCTYAMRILSDLGADIMCLEVEDRSQPGIPALEIICRGAAMTLTTYLPDLPLELVTEAISMAKRKLPPIALDC